MAVPGRARQQRRFRRGPFGELAGRGHHRRGAEQRDHAGAAGAPHAGDGGGAQRGIVVAHTFGLEELRRQRFGGQGGKRLAQFAHQKQALRRRHAVAVVVQQCGQRIGGLRRQPERQKLRIGRDEAPLRVGGPRQAAIAELRADDA